MSKKRIVVTGMGVVSCFGNDVDEFYKQLLAGKSGIEAITRFPCEDYPTRIAGAVKDFDTSQYIDRKQARRIDRYIAFTIVAGKKALEMAQIDVKEGRTALQSNKCGVIIGSGMGGMEIFCDNVKILSEQGLRRISPFLIPYIITNMGGALLAMDIGFQGPNYSISTACSTANYSIIAAASHIRSGDADVMLCGGAEAAVVQIGLAGFCSIKALSQRNDEPQRASRPWDRNRDGFVMGEGAGVLVLESLEHAQARGAPIYAEYLGGGVSCDAYHITDILPEGVALCLRNTLEDAGLKPEDVNYINAHATSTAAGDMVEIAAIKQVFPHSAAIAINATKSMTGHCLGAAGGVEAIATIKAITEGVIHPTINLEDPEEGLDFIVPRTAMEYSVKAGMSNSFGFGGHNACVVFAPYREHR